MATTASAQRDYYRQRVARRLEALGFADAACANCGSKKGIEFDHPNPQTRNGDFSQILRTGTDEAVEREAVLVRPLCMACHKRKSSVYLWKGTYVVLNDNLPKTAISRDGVWQGYTFEDPEEVESVLRMLQSLEEDRSRSLMVTLLDRIAASKARLAIYEAQYA